MGKLLIWKTFRKAEFTFNDYLDSMSQMKKMGGFANVLSMMPGIGGAQMKQIEDAMDEKKMARIEAIIYSMTPAERGGSKPDQSKQKTSYCGWCRCGYQRSQPTGKTV